MLATSFEWLRAATSARVDMTLTAFLVGAFISLERVVSAERPPPWALFGFYLCMGLAALGKGPVGFLLPGMVAIAYLVVRGDLSRIWRMRPFLGGAFTLVVAGSWYAAAIAIGKGAFVHKQLWVENVGRFFAAETSGAGHVHPWYYMVGGFFAGFAPWSLFVIPLAVYLYHARHRLESRGYLYPVVWFLVVLGFYSTSASKRTVYLLPLYPAVTLLLGAWWSELAARGTAMPRAVDRVLQVAGGLMGIVVLALVGILVGERSGWGPVEWLTPFLHEKDQGNLPVVQHIIRTRFAILAVWMLVLVPVIALFAVSIHRKRWVVVLASLVGFVASSLAVVNAVFHPELAWQRTFKPLMTVVRGVVGPEDRLFFYRAFDYGAVFYSERRILPLHSALPDVTGDQRRSYVLLWESVWNALHPEQKERLQFLHLSQGTGPKGRDRLVFALLKPNVEASAASAAPAAGSAGAEAPAEPDAPPTPPDPGRQNG
jgi:hypothetical protein